MIIFSHQLCFCPIVLHSRLF